MKIRTTTICIALALFGSSCTEDLREVRLVIDSDLLIPSELDEVFVEITASRTPEGQVCEPARRSFELESSDALPLILAIEPREEYTSWVAYKVTGHERGDVVIEIESRVSWPSEGAHELELTLDRRCLELRCGSETQCVDGDCAVVPTPEVFEDLDIRDVGIPCDATEQ